MTQKLVSLSSLFLLLSALPASARDSRIELSPSSDWIAEFKDESCAVMRTFGADDRYAQLELRRFSPDGSTRVILVAGPDLKAKKEAFRISWQPQAEWEEVSTPLFLSKGKEFAGSIFTTSFGAKTEIDAYAREGGTELEPVEFEKAAKQQLEVMKGVEALAVSGLFEPELLLRTGSLLGPELILDDCGNALLKSWGLDPQVQSSLSRKAAPTNLPMVVQALHAEFPRDLLLSEASANVRIRLLVGPDGKPSGCRVQNPIGSRITEKSSCNKLSRLRFTPALDAQGNPVTSYFATQISFRVG